MPRNGSGTYSLPSGNPVVTGSVISSTVHNNTMSDVATEMTNSTDKDGQTVITGTWDYNGNQIVLDADGDTSITADTDDVIDIEINSVDAIKLGWQSVADTGFITLDPAAFTADTTENTHRFALLNSAAITIPTGTTSLVSSAYFVEPNITATGTVTTAATVYIKDAPTEGATNYSLWVDAGAVKFDGTLEVTGATTLTGALTFAGALSIDDTTDTTSGTTGSIHTDGGVGIAKALFVGTTSTFIGVSTHGGNIVSDTDSTDDLGTTGVRWANLYVDDITATTTGTFGTSVVAGTATLAAGSLTDSSGAISFGNENLTTTGTAATGALTVTGLATATTLKVQPGGGGGGIILNANTGVDFDFRFQEASTNKWNMAYDASEGDILFYDNANTRDFMRLDQSASVVVLGTNIGLTTTGSISGGDATFTGASNSTADISLQRSDTTIAANDVLGKITAYTNDNASGGGSYTSVGSIEFKANGAFGPNDTPSSIHFNVIADATEGTEVEALRIANDKLVTCYGDLALPEGKVSITDTANEIPLNVTATSSTAVAALTQNTATSTNFHKYIDLGALTIWISDGTTAEGALTGVEGDICLNGGTGAGQMAYCDANGTNWTDM